MLEEYFFEDWEKIRLVLGDNNKGFSYIQIKQYNYLQQYIQASSQITRE